MFTMSQSAIENSVLLWNNWCFYNLEATSNVFLSEMSSFMRNFRKIHKNILGLLKNQHEAIVMGKSWVLNPGSSGFISYICYLLAM
jgi:hypothetical protein